MVLNKEYEPPNFAFENEDDAEAALIDLNKTEFKEKTLIIDYYSKSSRNNNCFLCGKPGHIAKECRSD